VSAYKKSFTGLPASITITTEGQPLPQVSGLVVEVSKTDGTTVTLRWDVPKDGMHKEKWEYGVYYALNTTDLLSGGLHIVNCKTAAVNDKISHTFKGVIES
jgi:hypothetical protein